MTFLELCQRVRQESGISGSGPDTVNNQKAILQKVVEWVRQADLDIQRMHQDWAFMWRSQAVQLITGQQAYTNIELNLLDMDTVLSIDYQGDELCALTWEQFKSQRMQVMEQQQRPTVYTIRPDSQILFYAVPDKDYSLTVEYMKKVQPMQNDDDISPIPERYHDAILHKALMYYASHEEDNSLYGVANMRFDSVLSELAASQLPQISLCRNGLY